MGFEIHGIDKTIRKFDRFKDVLPDRGQEAAEEYSEIVFDVSQILVPRDTGALADSGRTGVSDDTGSRRAAYVHYGNSSTDRVGVFYAAAVHERFDHYHAPPTQAKYVEQPLFAQVGQYRRLLDHYVTVAKNGSF